MERPKSAKHNIERLRKSAYLNKLNLINNRHFNNNSTNTNYTVVRPQDDNIDDLDDDDYNSILTIRRKEQRLQASKSAYIGGLSAAKQRPQSARHNLDKYRNDILLEKQKKLELIQKIYNQQNNPYHNDVDAHHTMNVVTTPQDFIKNNETNNSVEAMFPSDDIDNLDGLLIREEEDSSSEHEADYIDYKSNNTLTMNKKSKQNNKLLSRRIIETKENTNNNANNSIPNQMRLYRENTMNHTNNKKTVPALKDTETNVIYPTNINNINNNEIRSLLIQEKKQSISSLSNYTNTTLLQRPASGSTNTSNLIRTINTKIPSITTNLNKPKEELEATTTGLNTIDSAATNSSSSSTCSSTSSSVTASSKLNQPQIIHLNQLSSNSNDSQTLKQTKLTKNSLLSQELLNEWYKNDEEVDIRIEATKNMPDYDSTDYIEFDNTHLRNNNNTKNQQLQQRNVKSNLQKQSILLALNAGRTSRFSDYSSCSNKTSLSNLNKTNTKTNGYLSRERTNNSMDPWTKRNPTLVAQNVLIKHRAELEQLAARHNSNSRASNHSGLLATSNNKFLLPDTKYFKKNNF